MTANAVLKQPRQQHPSEQDVRDLLKELKTLRSDWGAFAVRSRPTFDAFQKQGASLSDDFLDGYADLEGRKADFVASVQRVCSSVPETDWKLPDRHDSLEVLESSLRELQKLCADIARKRWEERARVSQLVEWIAALRVSDASLDPVMMNVRRDAEVLVECIEGDLTEEPPADADEVALAVEALFQLILDSLQEQTRSPASDPPQRLSLDNYERCFDTVLQRWGRPVALAAASGRLYPAPGRVEEFIAAIATDGGGDTGPSEEQILELVTQFQGTGAGVPTGGAATESVTSPSIAPETIPEPPLTLQEMKQTADSLRGMADRICPPDAEAESQLDDSTRIRAIGYRNLAAVTGLVCRILQARGDDRNRFRQELHNALRLLAEAQNAVRVEYSDSHPDDAPLKEQDQLFWWLRYITDRDVEAFPIERFMRRGERADPRNNDELAKRIHKLSQQWKKERRAEQILEQLPESLAQYESGDTAESAKTIDRLVTEFVRCGRRVSDPELRETLLPYLDSLIEHAEETQWGSRAREVLTHLQRYMSQSRKSADEDTDSQEDSPEVLQVRELLRGRTVALVGGITKPEARDRIRQALQLKDLIWVPASKTDRVADLVPKIKDAAVVVLITSLIGHKHNELRTHCTDAGIPWAQTRKNAGFGVNQIASVILEQASEQLQN